MRKMKHKNNSTGNEKLRTSFIFGGGAGILTFFILVAKDKLGMHYTYIPPKTWHEVIEGLPLILAFSVGFAAVVIIGTLLFYKEEEIVLCPKCEEPFSKNKLPGLKCPKCDVPVVNIKRYYKDKKRRI